MSARIPALIPLSVALFVAAPHPDAARASGAPSSKVTDVAPGEQYGEGVRLRLAAHGVSWELPAGWIGGIPQGGAAFLMGSSSKPGIGLLIPVATSDTGRLTALLHETQDLGDGVVLDPAADHELKALVFGL